MANLRGKSVIRVCNFNPNLLTVFTPVDRREIREWWIQYRPEDGTFVHLGGPEEIRHQFGDLF
jgi:hypothetical protein